MILLKLFKTFNSNKANGHDNISISMLRIGGDTIKKYLELFFKAGPYHRHISFWSEKGQCSSCSKKDDKQNIKTTTQCLYYRYVAKFLKGFYLTCLIFLRKWPYYSKVIRILIWWLLYNPIVINYAWNLQIFWWWVWMKVRSESLSSRDIFQTKTKRYIGGSA